MRWANFQSVARADVGVALHACLSCSPFSTFRCTSSRVVLNKHCGQPKHRKCLQDPHGKGSLEAFQVKALGKQKDWVEIGMLGPPHGVRGEVKVRPLTDFPEERFGVPGKRWLRPPTPKFGRKVAAEPVEVHIEFGRSTTYKGYNLWIVKLEGIDTPEDAILLKGHSLVIPADERAELEDEDEFYVQDLVGLSVYMQESGQLLGKVVDVFDGTGSHDVLRIQMTDSIKASEDPVSEDGHSERPKFVLLPFAKQLVPLVDVTNARMEIVPPEGLLDLAASPAKKSARQEHRGKRERRGGGEKALVATTMMIKAVAK